MRRRPALVAFALVALVATVGLLALAATEHRSVAFTLGVPNYYVTAELTPGREACQTPIPVPTAFDAIDFQVDTYRRAGSRLAVSVVDAHDGTILGGGVLAPGYRGDERRTVRVGDVSADREITVCIRNVGERKAGVIGGPDITARTSNQRLDGGATTADLDLVFRRSARSTLAMVPEMLSRAALFRGSWIGPWTYWALLGCVLLAVPALIARALASTDVEDAPPGAD